jgi:hypothetical protein
VSGQLQNTDVPAASAIHMKLRAEHPPLQHIRPLDVPVILSPIMLSHGVRGVGAQVATLSAEILVVRSGFFGVPAVLKSRIGLVRRPRVRGYECGPTIEPRGR